jgi:hypothetical protein
VHRFGAALAAVVVSCVMVGGLWVSPAGAVEDAVDGVGVVDSGSGMWFLRDPVSGSTTSFFFGDPGDVPFVGDWDCDGVDTPGLYRQSDGYVYLRNANTQGVADRSFFFGDPGDVPFVGDFDGDGCDTVSIYRPSSHRFFVINALGADDGGLGAAEFSFEFGNPGDTPFVGDFDGDGVDTVGLHRVSSGLVYFRNTLTSGVADAEFVYGDPGDRVFAGRWTGTHTVDTVGLFRPSEGGFYLNHVNAAGNADDDFLYGNTSTVPITGHFGTLPGGHDAPPSAVTIITDSVVLGAERYFGEGFPGWQIEVLGKPAVMLHQIESTFFPAGKRVASHVVLAIGYNSIWERDRSRFDVYAAKFDREAEAVLDLVRAHGAKSIAWVTLREPSPEAIITAQQTDQNYRFGFYLPYVNERLALLDAKYDDLVLTDWRTVSAGPGWTYDLIHLNPAGAHLMVASMARAFGLQ